MSPLSSHQSNLARRVVKMTNCHSSRVTSALLCLAILTATSCANSVKVRNLQIVNDTASTDDIHARHGKINVNKFTTKIIGGTAKCGYEVRSIIQSEREEKR